MWPKVENFIDFIFNVDGFYAYTHQHLSSFMEESRHTIRFIQNEKLKLKNDIEFLEEKLKNAVADNQFLIDKIQEQQTHIHNLDQRFHKKLTWKERFTGRIK